MSITGKTKAVRDVLGQVKKATGLNNARLASALANPNSVRVKFISDAIAVPMKSYLNKHAKGAAAKKLISKVPADKIGTALMYANVANYGTQKLRDFLPAVAKGADWSMALPFNVLNQTLGRIPGIGGIFRAVHNFITEGVSNIADFFGMDSLAETGKTLLLEDPNKGFETNINWSKKVSKGDEEMPVNQEAKRKLLNAPSFYENLDLHKTFSIPGAYTKKTVVNGTMATPIIAVHRLMENPAPDVSAMVDRLNQKFSLIKAVRGLSATTYDLIDLCNYERFAKLILLEYYVIKKVIQAAKTYSLVQVTVGDCIIKSLGFVPSEVRDNLANYETLLCQIHRFISNNLPISGTWIKRLEYLVGANIPDYSDAKVATVHMFAVSMANVFYDRTKPESSHVFDCIPEKGNNSYSVLLSNFIAYQQDIVNNDKWQQLIADYFGAFGSQAMWEDKDYPAYSKPLDLRSSDNDLSREQIKNALYVNSKVTFITINSGVANEKLTLDVDDALAVQLPDYQFPTTFNYASENTAVSLTYVSILDSDAYLRTETGYVALTMGDTNKLLIPDHNGVGAQRVNVTPGVSQYIDMNNHETIYTLHKDSYSEGEALEISQFKARSIGMVLFFNDTDDKYFITAYHKTQEYAVMDTIVYTYSNNGVNVLLDTYRICDEVVCDDDLTDVESAVDFPEEIMCWALIDWMPLAHFTFFKYQSSDQDYYPRDLALIDMDAFGSLDDRAFSTSINYSIYSLQAAGLVIGKKRVDNLGSVYKDKSSKRG